MWTPLVGRGGMGGGAGGGRGGGGGTMRTVRRAIKGSVKEPFSQSSSSTTSTSRHTYRRGKKTSDVLYLSSSTNSSLNHLPVSSPSGSEEFDWECVDVSECKRGVDFYDDFPFGSVPSNDEVQFAVSALQQALNPAASSKSIKDRLAYDSDEDVPNKTTSPTVSAKRVSSVGTELDWVEPSLQLCGPRMLQPYGTDRVYDAFHLLQTDPCVQRMVVSLSSDKAVWDAVLKNEVVRELRESLSKVDNSVSENQDDDDDDDGSHGSEAAATNILSWIFDSTKAKVMELIEKITNLVNLLFQPPEDDKKTGDTEEINEKLRASFLLTIVVFLIVVVIRADKA